MAATKQAAADKPAAETKALRAEVSRLRAEVEALEADMEALEDALVGLEFCLRKGYICVAYQTREEGYIATCPSVHASVQTATLEEAWAELAEAMDGMLEVLDRYGETPPKDTEALCRD